MKKTKKIKLQSTKKLQDKALNLWKQICIARDGNSCQVAKQYPNIEIPHSDCIQVDHCITRGNKHLFFEPKNGTAVCSVCNMLKHHQLKSVHRIIDEIVKRRESVTVFDAMVALDKSKHPNHNFGKRWWLEEKIEELEKMLRAMDKGLDSEPVSVKARTA